VIRRETRGHFCLYDHIALRGFAEKNEKAGEGISEGSCRQDQGKEESIFGKEEGLVTSPTASERVQIARNRAQRANEERRSTKNTARERSINPWGRSSFERSGEVTRIRSGDDDLQEREKKDQRVEWG